MRILIYSANYAPEPTGIGKYSGEMAAWLQQNGHEVHVVCAPPYYPSWQLPKSYRSLRYWKELIDGVQVWRAPLWVPSQPGGAKRVLHLLSFALTSLPLMLRQAMWRPDVVFTVAPAFVCAPTGWLVARLSRAKSWLHIQDFEVDVAFQMGLLKGQRAQRAVLWIESKILRRFHIVSSISDRMMEKLMQKHVNPDRVRFFPNWVDISKITPLDRASSYRKELGIPDQAKVALFSGSLGNKQGLMVIPAAARLLAQLEDIVFVVCGDGVMKAEIEEACKDLRNVRLLPLQPFERLNDLLGLADVHLLPQSPEAEDLVLPSKLSGMLASGRPIIATCRPNTEIAKIVSQCGLVVPPEEPTALAQALVELVDERTNRGALGQRARQIAEERLGQGSILAQFVEHCNALTKLA